jgi:CheY-like chemotaxis protein
MAAQADRLVRSIIVVDDDPLARDALCRWLLAWGCRVAACADAAAARTALDGADGAAPDALITDWRLPGGEDGLEVIRTARQRHGPALPAILITGGALEDARRLAQQQGVVLLHKPVRPAALRAALSACTSPAGDTADRARA